MLVITGGSGKLGGALKLVFPHALFPTRSEFDMGSQESIHSFFARYHPAAVIHAAAYTDVRRAEQEKKQCWDTNARGTTLLVNALQRYNPACYFLYMSTACVFYGDRGDYSEIDIPHPKNFYGLTKLVGEHIAARMKNHLIVRTNFVARGPWPYPKAFTDRFGTYLYADDVAQGLKYVMTKHMKGIVHIVGDKKMSMLELARLTNPSVQPMTMSDTSLPLTIDMSLRSIRIAPFTFAH